MIVIGSNCCGANFHLQHDIKFQNPFIWAVTPYTDLLNIMNYWGHIKWFNIELSESPIKDNTFILTIDSMIHVHYVHYIFDHSADIPHVKGASVYYNCIWEYIIEKYFKRIRRMLSEQCDPVFIIHEEPYANGNNSRLMLSQIANLDVPYKRAIITRFQHIAPPNNTNVIVINDAAKLQPQQMIETYDNVLYPFLTT